MPPLSLSTIEFQNWQLLVCLWFEVISTSNKVELFSFLLVGPILQPLKLPTIAVLLEVAFNELHLVYYVLKLFLNHDGSKLSLILLFLSKQWRHLTYKY